MKNLEEEYKKFQKEETPDLWDRIEAGLPAPKKRRAFPNKAVYAGAAAVVLLAAASGLWMGRGRFSSEKDAAVPDNISAETALTGQESPVQGISAGVEEAAGESADIFQAGAAQADSETDFVSPDSMMDSASPGSGRPEEEGALKKEEAMELLMDYLKQEGTLPESAQRIVSEDVEEALQVEMPVSDGEEREKTPAACVWYLEDDGRIGFLEFSGYSEDGESFIFRLGERDEDGQNVIVNREYTVHTLTGDIAPK